MLESIRIQDTRFLLSQREHASRSGRWHTEEKWVRKLQRRWGLCTEELKKNQIRSDLRATLIWETGDSLSKKVHLWWYLNIQGLAPPKIRTAKRKEMKCIPGSKPADTEVMVGTGWAAMLEAQKGQRGRDEASAGERGRRGCASINHQGGAKSHRGL